MFGMQLEAFYIQHMLMKLTFSLLLRRRYMCVCVFKKRERKKKEEKRTRQTNQGGYM